MKRGAGDEILAARIRWARGIARALAVARGALHLRDDLASVGVEAMHRALALFDPDRGVMFETFAYRRVAGAVLRAIGQERRHARLAAAGLDGMEDAPAPEVGSAFAAVEDLAEQWMEGIALVLAGEDGEGALIEREAREALLTEVGRLPEGERRVVELREFEGLPWEEVARRLGVAERTARERHLRGRERLRGRLPGL